MAGGLFRPRGNSVPYSEQRDAEHQGYDDARLADEQRGSVKRGSYLAKRMAKKVDTVNPATPVAAVDITQANALPPDQVPDDHESLMRREG